MSCDIDSDSFHGTKKGGRRLTAIPAYQGDRRIRSCIILLANNLVEMKSRKMIALREYEDIMNALGNYAEHYKKPQRV